MLKYAKTTVVAALATVGGVIVAQEPFVASTIADVVRYSKNFVADGPEADLDNFKQELEQSLSKFVEAQQKLASQLESEETKASARADQLLKVNILLARFKEEYAAGTKSGFPRDVYGRSYTGEQIKEQVQVLLEQQAELQHTTNSGNDELQSALQRINGRLAETKQHLENMPVYEALARASDVVGASGEVLSGLSTCLAQNQAALNAGPVRDTGDLIAHEKSEQVVLSAEDFLAEPAPESAEQPSPAGAISIDDLIQRLRFVSSEPKPEAVAKPSH